jgi:hypothetical protein
MYRYHGRTRQAPECQGAIPRDHIDLGPLRTQGSSLEIKSLGTIIVIILVILLIGALPRLALQYRGLTRAEGVGLVLIVILVLVLMGKF